MQKNSSLFQWRLILPGTLIFLFLIYSCTWQEPISIKREKGAMTGRVLPTGISAIITAHQGAALIDSTAADTLGYYKLQNIKHGVYSLLFRASGYNAKKIDDITVYEGGTTAVRDIYLSTFPELIVDSEPVDGQMGCPLDGDISITFAQVMNKPSVEAALTITPKLKGRFLWNSGATSFSFAPEPELKTLTYYEVVLSTHAKTKYNEPLSIPFTFKFQTAPLEIVATFPYDGSAMVSTSSNIRLSFNSPLDGNSIENSIAFIPDIPGYFSGNDSKNIIFTPGTLLAPDTDYQVKIDSSLSDVYGVHLQTPEIIYFSTEPLQISNHFPKNGATQVSTNTNIMISFNAQMDQRSVETGFSISPAQAGTLQWDNFNSLRFTVQGRFEADTQYRVSLSTGCQAASGQKLPKSFVFVFTTSPL